MRTWGQQKGTLDLDGLFAPPAPKRTRKARAKAEPTPKPLTSQQKGGEAERRRRAIGMPPNPSMTDRAYDNDEVEFIAAMARYIEVSNNRFPTWSEALAVLKSLGYSKG